MALGYERKFLTTTKCEEITMKKKSSKAKPKQVDIRDLKPQKAVKGGGSKPGVGSGSN
jgi:hypothetical protein